MSGAGSLFADLARLARTTRHLKPGQVWHRVRLTLRRAAWEHAGDRIDRRYRARAAGLGPVRFDHPGLARVAARRLALRTDDERLRTARDALAGRFSFLGRSEDLGRDVAWHRPELERGTRLWKTLLHEFSFAVDLAATTRSSGDAMYRERLFDLIISWEAACPIGHPGFALDAWNARAVATRLVNLALAGSLLGLQESDAEGERLGRLLARHALFLGDNLEWDLSGNHLLRDAKGLVFAREIVVGAEEALPLLRAQVAEQVLPDGCHVERTPLYHAISLDDLIEARLLLGASAPAWLCEAIARMADYLGEILHGDGDLPLFGDTWRGEVDPQEILATARALARPGPGPRPARPSASHASGLVPLRSGDLHAVIRAGPHGPDHQLGHAHADLLSFELSRGTTRIVTDTGTGIYDPGERRAHLRSTAAHNTLRLDGEEQMEAWGSFRVGRRGRGRVEAEGSDGAFRWIWASHDGYSWLPGRPIHERLLAVSAHAVLVLDAVQGDGTHRVESRLHLHPELPEDYLCVLPLHGLVARGTAPLHERFGEVREMPELCVAEEAVLPWAGGWLLLLGPLAEGARGETARPLDLRRKGPVLHLRYADARVDLTATWDRMAAGSPRAVAISLCVSARPSAK